MTVIDEDKVYEDLANNLRFIMGDGSDGYAVDLYVSIGDEINATFRAQTRYDVDEILSQLNTELSNSVSAKAEALNGMCGASEAYYRGEENAYQKAIGIIEKVFNQKKEVSI